MIEPPNVDALDTSSIPWFETSEQLQEIEFFGNVMVVETAIKSGVQLNSNGNCLLSFEILQKILT